MLSAKYLQSQIKFIGVQYFSPKIVNKGYTFAIY